MFFIPFESKKYRFFMYFSAFSVCIQSVISHYETSIKSFHSILFGMCAWWEPRHIIHNMHIMATNIINISTSWGTLSKIGQYHRSMMAGYRYPIGCAFFGPGPAAPMMYVYGGLPVPPKFTLSIRTSHILSTT